MFIECLIKKWDESDVFVDFEGVRYIFTKNALGHAVCYVGNQLHARRLLAMGDTSYREYTPPEGFGQVHQVGATPVHIGQNQPGRPPTPNEPLPDAMTVDQSLTDGGQVEKETTDPAPSEVTWADEAIETKIKEFKFLAPDNFKAYIDDNRGNIMGWPVEVRSAIAKKLDKNFPDLDPDIEGFKIDDYLGRGNTVDS